MRTIELDKIYHGDCFELVKEIPDESIDMILTDPPYGTTQNSWDKVIDIKKFMAESLRIIKPHGAILVFTQMPFAVDVIQAARQYYRYEWILEKYNASGFLNANRMPLKAHEAVQVFYKHLPTFYPQKTKGRPYNKTSNRKSHCYGDFNPQKNCSPDGMRYPRDVLKFQWRKPGSSHYHETEKPVSACRYFIRTYSNSDDIILDMFIGSGTTAVAAIREGRHFIGFEKEQEYFDVACKRVIDQRAAAASELPLRGLAGH